MTRNAVAIAVIETTRAGPGDGPCGSCGEDFIAGQRIVLVRRDGEHAWIHVRHVAEQTAPVATERNRA